MRYNLPTLNSENELHFITIEDVKEAIASNDFERLLDLYYLFLNRDLKIAEGIEKRRDALLNLNYTIENRNPYIEKFLEDFNIKRLVKLLSDAIYYGFSIVDVAYEVKGGLLHPRLKKISPLALHYKESEEAYYFIEKGSSKEISLKSIKEKIIFYNHTAGEKFINESLAYKVLFYAILKHTAITLNMQYFDSLAIPPLIVKGGADDEEKVKELMTQIALLKSNSFGVFSENVTIDSLKASTQAEFLETINYFDNLISHYITGQGISAEGSKGGSFALAKSVSERFKEKVRSDASMIEEEVTKFLNRLIKLNTGYAPVKFSFLFSEDINKKEFTQIVKTLKESGYEVDAKFVSEMLKMPVKKAQEERVAQKQINAAAKNSTQKPLSYQEEQLLKIDTHSVKEELNLIYKILNECSSYEEALSKIEKFDNPKLEELLASAIFANGVLGELER